MEEPRAERDVAPSAPAVFATCTCAKPLPTIRATHKGAARTVCDRCGLPVRIDFGR
jgi:hypothetical protein